MYYNCVLTRLFSVFSTKIRSLYYFSVVLQVCFRLVVLSHYAVYAQLPQVTLTKKSYFKKGENSNKKIFQFLDTIMRLYCAYFNV